MPNLNAHGSSRRICDVGKLPHIASISCLKYIRNIQYGRLVTRVNSIETELTFHGGKHNGLIFIHRTIKNAPEAVQKPTKVWSKAGKPHESALG